MSNGLYRLGRWIAAHHRLVLVAWVVAVLGLVGLNRVAGGDAVDDFRVPGVESQAAVDLLEQRFPERAGATAMVVFHVDDGTVNDPATAAAIDATITEVASLEHVLAVTDPLAGPRAISPDGSTAFAAVQFDGSTAELGPGGKLTVLGPRKVRVEGAVLLDVAPGQGQFQVVTGAGELSAEAFKKQLFALGSSISFSCGDDSSTIRVSGIDANMEKTLALLDTWFRQPRLDPETLVKLGDNTLSQRKDGMEDPDNLWGVLGDFAQHDRDAASLHEPTNKQITGARVGPLGKLISGALDHQHKTMYYGPRAGADAAPDALRVEPLVARRPRHRHAAHPGVVEPLCQDSHVGEDDRPPLPEISERPRPILRLHGPVDEPRRHPQRVQRDAEVPRVIDSHAERDRPPVARQLLEHRRDRGEQRRHRRDRGH